MGIGILRLRKTHNQMNRPFRIGKKGNGLIWFIVIILFATMAGAVGLTLATSSITNFIVVTGATVVLFLVPFLINKIKKASWKTDVEKMMGTEPHNIPKESVIEASKAEKQGTKS